MRIHVRLTEDIINQSLALHYHDQPSGKKMKQRLLWIPFIMVAISVYLIYTELQQPQAGQNFYMALLYISFALVYYFFMKSRMMRAGKKLLKNLGENASFDMDADEATVTTITSSATITQPWTAFTGALISSNNVLLYQANHSFSMFHPSFFAAGDFEKFKELVRNHVQPVLEV